MKNENLYKFFDLALDSISQFQVLYQKMNETKKASKSAKGARKSLWITAIPRPKFLSEVGGYRLMYANDILIRKSFDSFPNLKSKLVLGLITKKSRREINFDILNLSVKSLQIVVQPNLFQPNSPGEHHFVHTYKIHQDDVIAKVALKLSDPDTETKMDRYIGVNYEVKDGQVVINSQVALSRVANGLKIGNLDYPHH